MSIPGPHHQPQDGFPSSQQRHSLNNERKLKWQFSRVSMNGWNPQSHGGLVQMIFRFFQISIWCFFRFHVNLQRCNYSLSLLASQNSHSNLPPRGQMYSIWPCRQKTTFQKSFCWSTSKKLENASISNLSFAPTRSGYIPAYPLRICL